MTSKELVEFCMWCSSCEECCYDAECEAYENQFNYYPCELKYLDFILLKLLFSPFCSNERR